MDIKRYHSDSSDHAPDNSGAWVRWEDIRHLIVLKKVPSDCAKNEDFMAFYNAYPKHSGREDAYRAWNQVKPDKQAVLEAISWQRKSKDHLDREPTYIPLPATWLRGRRWEDDKPGWTYKEQVKTVQRPIIQVETHRHEYSRVIEDLGNEEELAACKCGSRIVRNKV